MMTSFINEANKMMKVDLHLLKKKSCNPIPIFYEREKERELITGEQIE